MTNLSINNNSLFMQLLKMQRQSMSIKRRKATQKQSKKAWLYPSSVERKYARQIVTWIKKITERVQWEIENNLQRWIDEYNLMMGKIDSHLDSHLDAYPEDMKIFNEDMKKYIQDLLKNNNIRLMITNIGMDTAEINLKQWLKLTKGMLGLEFAPIETWETDVISAWGETNYNLITTLPDEYIKKVNTLISEGVQYGKTHAGMLDEMKKITKTFTRARPQLIARDQVGKLNGALTKRRQEDADISMYIWMTAGDERVRGKPGGKYPYAIPSHWEIHGKICRWDDASVYSKDGINWKKRTSTMPSFHPGYAIQCRCTAIPYFTSLLKKIDEELVA